MTRPTSRVDFCAARLKAAMERHGVHPDVDAAINVLIGEVAREAFVGGAVFASPLEDAAQAEVLALVHFENVLTAHQIERHREEARV